VCYPLRVESGNVDEGLGLALAGDRRALEALLARLTPVVQARAARALGRRSGAAKRDARQELLDMVQEVFVALLDQDARALRAWQRDRGLSLENFVGLVAERQVASILRTGRRSPWTDEPMEDEALELRSGADEGPLAEVASRELASAMLARLREELTPKMLHVFYALWVHETPIAALCEEVGMTVEAVYMARSRIAKRARAIAERLLDSNPSQRISKVQA
jgi:RNA polymerase sigma-70 factor (ECF subfamily)